MVGNRIPPQSICFHFHTFWSFEEMTEPESIPVGCVPTTERRGGAVWEGRCCPGGGVAQGTGAVQGKALSTGGEVLSKGMGAVRREKVLWGEGAVHGE